MPEGSPKSLACSGSTTPSLLPFASPGPDCQRRRDRAADRRSGNGETSVQTEGQSEIGNIAALAPVGNPAPVSKYDRLIARAREIPSATTVVAYPCEETALRGPVEAAEAGIIVPILVGPALTIAKVAREHGIEIGRYEIVDVPDSEAAAARA